MIYLPQATERQIGIGVLASYGGSRRIARHSWTKIQGRNPKT